MTFKSLSLVAALALAGTAVPGIAQNPTTASADPYATEAPEREDDDFPWGLLGLAGLAGLLGLKRRDDNARHTSTDNRR